MVRVGRMGRRFLRAATGFLLVLGLTSSPLFASSSYSTVDRGEQRVIWVSPGSTQRSTWRYIPGSGYSPGYWYRPDTRTPSWRYIPRPQQPPAQPPAPQQPPVQPPAPEQPPVQPPIGDLSPAERELIGLINEARAAAGRPPLVVDPQLMAAARAKSQDMMANNYFSHSSPTYGPFPGVLNHFGVRYRMAGENIARAQSVAQAHTMFMQSAGHKANILNPSYTHVGVGVVGGSGGLFITEEFIAR